MLKKFTVSNFKNFKNEFTLDFTRIKNYEFNQECVVNCVVSQSVIYGCNGSGKTNLALAVFDIHNHLKDDKVSKEYKLHYLNAESNAKRANFSYFFQFGENEVVYKYQKSSYDILEYESLIINDKLRLCSD